MVTSTYGARAAAIPDFMALRTPGPIVLRYGRTPGISACSRSITGTVMSSGMSNTTRSS